jgi:hypothetical protein
LPEALPVFAARKYAREFVNLFPKMAKRAELLKLLPVSKGLPQHLLRYLIEASRCFIYGQFLACLVLCRSAIENAIETRLSETGYGNEVANVTRDKLINLLTLALDKRLVNESTYLEADQIRTLANHAIHGTRIPDGEECKRAFHRTRYVIQELLNGALK